MGGNMTLNPDLLEFKYWFDLRQRNLFVLLFPCETGVVVSPALQNCNENRVTA